MTNSQMIIIETKTEPKKIKYMVCSAIVAGAILSIVVIALLITNTENIKTKAGIEIVNEMNGNILELKDSVNSEGNILSFLIFQMKFINQSILELSSSLLYLREKWEKIPKLSSNMVEIQELSSNTAELNRLVNELETMKQQQINEISSNVDELSTQVESNSASFNQLTVGVEMLNQIIQNIGYVPEGFVSTSIAPSCSSIIQQNPLAPSGYYNVQSSNGSAVRVYCDMTRTCGNITGGWMRVAELDMTRTSSQCPPSLCLNTTNPHTCRICSYAGNCSLDIYPVGINYSRVCGRVIGYQVGTPDAFSIRYTSDFDGIQLTYAEPRTNIWTFAAAYAEVYDIKSIVCPCINSSDPLIQSVPESIGSHYFCDTAAHAIIQPELFEKFFTNNTLWDGAGCGPQNACCSFNNPPWFYRELPNITNDDIEMRVCRDEDRSIEDVAVEVVDIYVQ